MSEASPRPLPSDAERLSPFWQGARERRVCVQRCAACGQFRFPEAPICARCLSTDSLWQDVAPAGIVKAWCRFHRAYFPGFALPYAVLLVELEGGARVYANLSLDASTVTPRIGMRVDAVFEDVVEDVTMLAFRPAAE